MTSAHKHAHGLASEIGPRPPTSAAEARAASYCAAVLEQAGLETRVEPFKGFRSFGQIYVPTTAASFLAALLGMRKRPRRLAGAALGLAGISVFWGEQTSRWRPLTNQFASGPSQNVVAVLTAAGEARRRLVIVAHVDSSRSGLMFHPKVAGDFRRSTLIGVAAGIGAVGAWLLPRRMRRLIAGASAAVLGNSLALLLQRELTGRDVHGANDNASGAGVLLAVAEALALEPLSHTEVWFVVTGCEESDLVGMSAFIDRHHREVEDAWFLNLDSTAGEGATVRWITESSILEALRADAHLLQLAEEVAADHPEFEAEPGVWRAAGLDTDVAGVRGMRQMSIMALAPEGTLPNWHWPTDTIENLDEGLLEKCYVFVLEIVRRFDSYS